MGIKDMDAFLRSYKTQLIDRIKDIDVNVISNVALELIRVSKNKNRIFIIGNGGSAATASHIVNDFGAGLKRRGVLCLDIVSLSDNIATVTALSNDVGYDEIYINQLKGIIRKGDVLMAISCSGNSENIIKAVEYSKNNNATIIGLTGFNGGKLKKISDINFHVQTEYGEYGVVEDVHMIFDHILYTYFIKKRQND
jgi:D-sedoheptulose 7-phosphate isomerase